MKVAALADTHTYHDEVDVPGGDLLIYAGDACLGGSTDELASFMERFRVLPHEHKVMIAGNHDGCLELDLSFARKRDPALLDNICRKFYIAKNKQHKGGESREQ